MTDLNAVLIQQPWRVRAIFAGAGSFTTLTDWSLTSDVGEHDIADVWALSPHAVELTLTEPLVAGLRYVLTHAGASAPVSFSYFTPPTDAAPADDDIGDPEAEAFGVDADWLADDLTASGDVPEVRGLAALRHDLAGVAVLSPGELVHRPLAGVGVRRRVNAAADDAAVSDVTADLVAAFRADDRVSEANASVTTDPATGTVRVAANVLTPQLPGESIGLALKV